MLFTIFRKKLWQGLKIRLFYFNPLFEGQNGQEALCKISTKRKVTLNLLNVLFLLGLFVTFLTIFMAIAQFSWSSDNELQPLSPVIKCSISYTNTKASKKRIFSNKNSKWIKFWSNSYILKVLGATWSNLVHGTINRKF